MKLDWMGLANYAEDQGGLLNIIGGGWDTINVQAPTEGAPDNVFTVIRGMLVIRMLFHTTETGRDHTFEITVQDADGQTVGNLSGGARVDKTPGLPPGWDQNVNLVLPLTGFPLPGPGQYTINLQVNGQFVGDRPFRVIKAY